MNLVTITCSTDLLALMTSEPESIVVEVSDFMGDGVDYQLTWTPTLPAGTCDFCFLEAPKHLGAPWWSTEDGGTYVQVCVGCFSEQVDQPGPGALPARVVAFS